MNYGGFLGGRSGIRRVRQDPTTGCWAQTNLPGACYHNRASKPLMILLGFALISGAHLALGKEFKEAGGQLSQDNTVPRVPMVAVGWRLGGQGPQAAGSPQ